MARFPFRFRLVGTSLIAIGAMLAAPCTAANAAGGGLGQPDVPVATPQRTGVSPKQSEKGIRLTVPAKDGATYLGDISIVVAPDQSFTMPADRTLALLAEVLAPEFLETLRASFAASEQIVPQDLAPAGVSVRFDQQSLELVFDIPVERRAARTVAMSSSPGRIGEVLGPADVSAYVNVRGSFDFVEDGADEGFENPTLLLDGAFRLGNIVAESDAIWTPGARGHDFQRLGSRFVYDDQNALVRWSVGDLEPTGRGFQAVPDISGVSAFRSYSVLSPQQVIRPRGDRSFRLERAATVEVIVNGQQVRRLQLAPGNYDLRDFPFAQGANDVRLNILDDAGRTEVLRFNIFLDQTQLGEGLSEFGLYAGVRAPLGPTGPDYSDDWVASGYYRRGISDYVTLGINAQADKNSRMVGVEAVLATSIGTIGTQTAYSHNDFSGSGYALQATFQRLIQRGNGLSDTLNLFAERRSADFGPVSFFLAQNPFDYEIGGGYSHAFSSKFYAGVDGRYGKGRGTRSDVANLRLTGGWRLNDRLTLNTEGRYTKDSLGDEFSVFASLTVRLGRFSSLRGEYDTRDNRARASFQTLRGSGVGSYNLSADIERSDFGSGISMNGNYFGNRAELGISHFGAFDGTFGGSSSQRTNFRLGTSIAAADGAVAIGRPIYDSFAIVQPHGSLSKANVVVDPTPFGYVSETGSMGTATMPSLSSYAERTVTVNLEGAPPGVDIGKGSYRLFPAYRSGYRLEVGSGYNVTAMGTMLDQQGNPVSLVAGTATEEAHPEREPVTVFTNRQGRFGAAGLAPGRWRIEMLDENRSVFIVDIPEGAEGVVRLEEIRPAGSLQ